MSGTTECATASAMTAADTVTTLAMRLTLTSPTTARATPSPSCRSGIAETDEPGPEARALVRHRGPGDPAPPRGSISQPRGVGPYLV
jgi:hypothetical protein